MDLDSTQQAELKLLFTKKDKKRKSHTRNGQVLGFSDKIIICRKFEDVGKGGNYINLTKYIIDQEYNNFSDLIFIKCRFKDCRMYPMYANRWSFIKSQAKFCDFSQSEFTDSVFVHSNLECCNFSQSEFTDSVFVHSNLECCNFSWGTLDGVVVNNCNLVEVILEGASLRNATLISVDLSRANLKNAVLDGAVIYNCKLEGANLEGASLRNATLISVDLSRANLKNAVLDGAVIYNCKLILSQMYNIKTSNTIFRSNQLYNDYLYEKIKFGIQSLEFKYRFKIQKKQLEESEFNDKNDFNGNLSNSLKGNLNIDTQNIQLYAIYGEYTPYDLRKNVLKENILEECKDSIIEYAGTMDVNEYIGDDMKKLKHYRDAVKNYKYATWVYNKLYELSNQNGEYELADEILYRMNETKNKLKKVMILHELCELLPSKDKSNEIPKRNPIKMIYNIIKNSSLVIIYELLKVFCGYGLKPIRAAITSLGIIVTFSILYNITRCVEIQGKTNTNIGFLNSLYFSIVTFTSLGYANMQPNIAMGVSKLLVAAESLLGVLLLSLVIYSITMQARSK